MTFSALSAAGAVHGFHDGTKVAVCGRQSLAGGDLLRVIEDADGSRPAFPPPGLKLCRKCARHYRQCQVCLGDNPFAHPAVIW